MLAVVACASLSFDGSDEPSSAQRMADAIRAEPALLSVDTKHAAKQDVGLWRRDPDGETYRIWEGSPYDSRWLPDRSILVVERWAGRALWLGSDGELRFEKRGLREPVDIELALDGTLVVVERGAGRVVGLDPESGEVLWMRSGFVSPFDAAPLERGHLLVADSDGGRVVELDEQGALLWTYRTPFPNTVEPLDGGGVLISNWTRGDVIELGHDHKLRWKTHIGGTLYSAERMPDGLTVVCDGGGKQVVFLDERGRPVKREPFAPGCVDYETILEL